jgi:hypothetical protein
MGTAVDRGRGDAREVADFGQGLPPMPQGAHAAHTLARYCEAQLALAEPETAELWYTMREQALDFLQGRYPNHALLED